MEGSLLKNMTPKDSRAGKVYTQNYYLCVLTSRFVPMDVSYPDDSYPGSDVSYPTFSRFVPNPLVDSYPTNYDTKHET